MESTQAPIEKVEQQQEEQKQEEDLVTAFTIQASSEKGVDYAKLVDKFGCTPMNDDLKAKIERLTGAKPHRFIRRDIFFCHRDLDVILNRYE